MSVRAYQVLEIKTSGKPSFNLSENLWLADHASWEASSGSGEYYQLEFSKKDLKEALREEQNKEKKKVIKDLLLEFNNNEFILYSLF